MMRKLGLKRSHRVAKALVIVTFLVGVSVAAVKGKGILFPEWSGPTAGDYDDPSSDMGKKAGARRPWSVTTMASSIEGKPITGKPVSVVGEIIDLSCYLQVGKHGDKHRGCGQKCAANGQPIGLLAKDGTVYMLIDEEHDQRRDGLTEFRKQAIEQMAHIVKVNGTLTQVDGQNALFVQGYLKEQ